MWMGMCISGGFISKRNNVSEGEQEGERGFEWWAMGFLPVYDVPPTSLRASVVDLSSATNERYDGGEKESTMSRLAVEWVTKTNETTVLICSFGANVSISRNVGLKVAGPWRNSNDKR